MRGLFVGILHVVVAVKRARGHTHPRNRTADLALTANAAAKGGGDAQGELLIHIKQIAERDENRLRAVAPVKEKLDRFFASCHFPVPLI